MRLLALFKKSMIENLRDWKILILTMSFAPFFVLLMYFYFGSTTKTFRVIVVNHDQGVTTQNQNLFYGGQELISIMMNAKYPEGTNILKVHQEKKMEIAHKVLKKKSADLIVEIPKHFSRVLLEYKQDGHSPPVVVKTYGDLANAMYIMAAVWCDSITYKYMAEITGKKSPIELQSKTIGNIKSLNDFELYVPALLGLALIMLMFTAAASIIKEKDKGTIIRLRCSNMRVYEWLSAVSSTQVIIGLLSMGLTYLTAAAMGYQSSGSMFAFVVVGLLSSLAIIAISLVVAAFLRTVFDLTTIGCFPFFILMFFSGGMFPLPNIQLFAIGSRFINVNDILPTTHTISALGKILNFGAGLGEVAFEIGAIAVLTTVYFAAGLWLFNSRHLKPK